MTDNGDDDVSARLASAPAVARQVGGTADARSE